MRAAHVTGRSSQCNFLNAVCALIMGCIAQTALGLFERLKLIRRTPNASGNNHTDSNAGPGRDQVSRAWLLRSSDADYARVGSGGVVDCRCTGFCQSARVWSIRPVVFIRSSLSDPLSPAVYRAWFWSPDKR